MNIYLVITNTNYVVIKNRGQVVEMRVSAQDSQIANGVVSEIFLTVRSGLWCNPAIIIKPIQ